METLRKEGGEGSTPVEENGRGGGKEGLTIEIKMGGKEGIEN